MCDGLTPLGPIPDGWSVARLRELSNLIERGITPRYVDNSPHVVVNQRSIRWVGIDYSAVKHLDLAMAAEVPTRKRLVQGDVVLNSTGDITIGRACLISEPVENHVSDSHVTIIRLRKELFEPYLLVQFLQMPHFQREIYTVTSGSTGQLELSRQAVANLVLPVPPLPEQRKIAEILSSVDDAIEKTEAVIEQVRMVKQGLAQQLLTRGLPGRHARFKQTEVGEIPEEWAVTRVQELASAEPRSIQSGPFGSSLRHSEFQDTGVLVIGIDNVLDGRFSMGSQHRISYHKSEQLRQYEARPLDVLITVMATVGRSCLVPPDLERAIITKHVYRITVDRSKCDPSFLMWCFLYSPVVLDQFFGTAQGQTRPGLNGGLIKRMRLPLPRLDEQTQVAELLARMDARIDREEIAVRALQHVKSAVMHVLLTGQVRVKVASGTAASAEEHVG